MKASLLPLFVLVILLSCSPEEPTTSREETGLVGQWKEIAEKSPHFDTAGVFIDSIDISASYTFESNQTYTSVNDVWTNANAGTWEIDSTNGYLDLYIYPSYPSNPGSTRKDRWVINTLNSKELKVEHFYKITVNGNTFTVLLFRKFKRM